MSARKFSHVVALYVAILMLPCYPVLSQRPRKPYNPCPAIFTYAFDGFENYGIIEQKNISKTRNQITIGLSQPGILNQNYKGKISPIIGLNRISEYIEMGLSITYRVDFPQQNVLPRVAFIIENGIRICSAPKDPFPRADIMMIIVLQEEGKSRALNTLESVCGQENESSTRLIKRAVHGELIEKSRFPWIAALFEKHTDNSISFQCGATLISKRTVLTAAYCFQKAGEFEVGLGRHELMNSHSGVNIGVKNIIIHPDYRTGSNNFDGCIAIAHLETSVTFSHEIRPICLWKGPADQDLIEGVTGVTVGWDYDGEGSLSRSLPKLVRTRIVSMVQCLRSNIAFVEMTSNRTFCAGNRDGTGPCVGDSGNGLMIKQQSKWTLRGIVSAGLVSSVTNICNPLEYIVYTDVATFLEWVMKNMLLE